MANQELTFEITKQAELQMPQQYVTGRLGDGGLKALTIKVLSDQRPYDLTGMNGKFFGMKSNGLRYVDDKGFVILDPQGGVFRFVFESEAFDCEGDYQEAFFKLFRGDQCDSTLSLQINVLPNKIEMGINTKEYISDYARLVKELNEKTDEFLEALAAKENSFEDQVKVIQGELKNIQDAMAILEQKIKSDDLVTETELNKKLAAFDCMLTYDPDEREIV